MNTRKNYIDVRDIKNLVYDDENYVREFASAAIQSFNEFSDSYSKYLLARDETNFRKTGHRIKPVAQMLHIPEIIEEYERAKTLLQEEQPEKELEDSAQRITGIVDDILAELKEIA